MRKKEQQFATKIQKYMRARMDPGFFWETKYVYAEKGRYNYKSDKSLAGEIRVMTIAQEKGMCYKFSDIGFFGTPCDGLYFKGPGLFFFQFEVSSPLFYCIKLDDMIKEVESDRKSLTEERARAIAFLISKHI